VRVLLLNQFYPPDTAATGQLLADVARGLGAAGHEVHVICSRGLYGGGVVRGEWAAAGVRVHRVGALALGRRRGWARMCDWGSYYGLATAEALRLGRFDTCLALTTPPLIGLAGALVKRLGRTRLVLWMMDVWPDVAEALGTLRRGSGVSRVLHAAARSAYGEADAVISLGARMTAHLAGQGVAREKLVTVANWVPGEAVRPEPWGTCGAEAVRGLEGRWRVMYSGNLGMAHEFETFLDAAERLSGDGRTAFIFCGEGSRREALARAVGSRGLGGCVRLAPPAPLARLGGLLGSGHVQLVSMRPEAAGLLVPSKVYGILASGRPAALVGPETCEVARLLRESGAGRVVGIGEGEALAAELARLRDDEAEARRMGEAGRRYYEERLGRDRSVPRIVAAVTGGAR
jgi:glycosyltransferase involved in cell wall biosynthesis